MKELILASALTVTAGLQTAQAAGLDVFDMHMPHHGQSTSAAIWYPSAETDDATVFADNIVFKGVDGVRGATISDGPHPVIILSHGFGGGVQSMAWMAQGLADRGAIVVTVAHINTTWAAFDVPKGVRHWTRVQDMSTALDYVLSDSKFADHIDPRRIMAAGFSYGGWSALSMGGATSNHAGVVAACERFGEAMSYCPQLLSDDVNLAGIDPNIWNKSYKDARVTHVAAVDPGFVWGHDATSVVDLVDHVAMIGLGDQDSRLIATDFETSGLQGLLPNADVDWVVPAVHFTAMPECKWIGPAFLWATRDDPVCTDPNGAERAHVHQRIIGFVADQIGLVENS